MNFCCAILLLNILYIVSTLPDATSSTGSCVVATAFFHYFLLVSFLWMLVKVGNIHQMLINVFISYETNFMVKRFLFAWSKCYFYCKVKVLDINIYIRINSKIFYYCLFINDTVTDFLGISLHCIFNKMTQ